MNQPLTSAVAVQRLTALWAFSEAGLGGILHALNMPFKGLALSAITAMCITLIAYYSDNKAAILRSLIIVLIVKMLGAPNSSPAAYIAVGFQGVIGFLLFTVIKSIRFPALILTVVAITYSSIQKIIIAYIIYGEPLAKAINQFGNYTLKFFGVAGRADLVFWLCAAYIGIHLIAGIVIGIFAGKLPGRIEQEAANGALRAILPAEETPLPTRKRRKWRMAMFLIIPLLLLLLFTLFFAETPEESAIGIAIILIRIVCILALWYGVIAKFAMKFVRKVLVAQRRQHAAEVENVLLMLPVIRSYILPVWRAAGGHGLQRLGQAITLLIAVALHLPQIDGGEMLQDYPTLSQ